MADSPIGLIGVGLLGSALAERMLAAGFDVLGHDLNPSAEERLRAVGGRPAAAAAEIAGRCDVIVLCLPNSDVVDRVLGDISDLLRSDGLIIDATTGDPNATEAIAQRLSLRGIGYVDATIAGSSEQARNGGSTVIIGGSDENVRRATSVLASWSDRRFHVGPAGSGARMKLVVNLVLGLNRAALAEGLSLARACGIDAAAALDVLRQTPAHSTVMETKGPKMVSRDYAPQARLAQHLKDVRLIRQLVRRHGALAPLTDVHELLLQKAVELGYGDADNSALIEAFQPNPSSPQRG
jgi:3-hydroxyisobutyrate dehydrogenase-like beta-hydroxyacid dehydrogenase